MVQIRWFIGKTKWVRGRVSRKSGEKLYEVDVGNKKLVRHIDHVIQVRSLWNRRREREKETGTEEWYDSVKINEPVQIGERRYPDRVRRSVVRYGIDE